MSKNPDLIVDIISDDKAWVDALPDVEQISSTCCYQAWKKLLGSRKIKKPLQAEVAVYLTNDVEITKLNAEYRHKNKPTNVLSFPMFEGWEHIVSISAQVPQLPLGDIVIARETIMREATEQHKSFGDHYSHMLIHGLLHLCGYDHQNEQDAEIMESLEADILQTLGIANPYI